MMRKSKIVSLTILGGIAALGFCCCCANWMDSEPDPPPDKEGKEEQVAGENRGQGGHGHRSRGIRWIPIFFGGRPGPGPGPGVGHVGGPSAPSHGGSGSSSTSRGGFGSTAGHSGGGIGA